ncbi:5'-nucleotidase [Luteibacter jiangsuensis]|uniref:5'-nucleotidase n=1 Tax=Luteibacter jiangsuensis TaxID=637577 RepID=UPI001F033269|nr:5'-nucleotidase [Luteibacter jiangsuensis]
MNGHDDIQGTHDDSGSALAREQTEQGSPGLASAQPTAHAESSVSDNRLVVAISSRALFDMGDSHDLFEREGLDAYRAYQIEHEDDLLKPGVAFPLVQKLLGLNALSGDVPAVEVILLSRNSGDTGLRIFNAIQHYKLGISRAAFTSGAPTSDYIAPFRADLFLSANAEDVGRALRAGVAAATILPSTAPQRSSEQLRIAFDGDAVIFGDEGERVSKEQGLDAFHRNETERWAEPLSGGPFRGFLAALHRLQAAFPAETSPIRTALVTARSAPAHKRVILTLRRWGVRIDEALFLGGRDKGPFLDAFGADIFFDDSPANVESARRHVATGHVPHGVSNL